MTRSPIAAKLRAVRTALRRHPPRILLLWALGALLILASALALSDPALVMFALDPELVALLVVSSVALLRANPAVAVARAVATSAGRRFRASHTPRHITSVRARDRRT